MNGNPFYVAPMGGIDISKSLGGLASAIANSQKQGQAQQAKQDQLKQASAIMQTNDPAQIADFALQNPAVANQLTGAVKFKNQLTKQNMTDSMRRILSGQDPETVIKERINMVSQAGGDPSDSINELASYRADPDKFMQSVNKAYALSDPAGYKALQSAMPQTAKPQPMGKGDVAIQNFERYKQLQKTDPELAGYFGKTIGIEPKQKAQGTSAIQNFEAYTAMPSGREKTLFGQSAGILPKEKTLSPSEKIKLEKQHENKINAAKDTLTAVEDFLSNTDYVNTVSGWTGKAPTVFPSSTSADAAFDTLRDNLTLANLDKISGVLTDTDMRVIASASSGLKYGMDRNAMVKQLNKIVERLKNKIGLPANKVTPTTQQDIKSMSDDDLIGGMSGN